MRLRCSCCGGVALAHHQWWNRDKGFGICSRCVTDLAKTMPPDRIKFNYGIEGIHYIIQPEQSKETDKP